MLRLLRHWRDGRRIELGNAVVTLNYLNLCNLCFLLCLNSISHRDFLLRFVVFPVLPLGDMNKRMRHWEHLGLHSEKPARGGWAVLLAVVVAGLAGPPAVRGQLEILPQRPSGLSKDLRARIGQVLLDSSQRYQSADRPAPTPELQMAEGLFQSNQAPRALALLAAVVRDDAFNQAASDRLLAELTQRSFGLLAGVSNLPVQPPFDGRLPRRSPDGQRELRRWPDGAGQIHDLHTDQPLGAPLSHAKGITAAWFSPDGLRVATTSNPDGSARIWDATTGLPLSPLLRHRSYVNSARFSPNGLLLMTGSATAPRGSGTASRVRPGVNP